MLTSILRNFNGRITMEDQCVCVGDLLCRGAEKGCQPERSGRISFRALLPQLDGHWTFVAGNHDGNNGVKPTCNHMFVSIFGLLAFVSHVPMDSPITIGMKVEKWWKIRAMAKEMCQLVICGHVHSSWKAKRIGGIVHVNVGVDANKFYPLDDSEVAGIYHKFLKGEKENGEGYISKA
jgi:calcineurin-like phosphoesterase family protein